MEIKGYGKLSVDKVIFESYFPIIFTCTNEKKELFLCVCCQNNEKGCKWLVGKTNSSCIVSMLRDEITVRDLLLNYSDGRITVDYVNGEYKISYDNSDWESESIYLPKIDSYLDVEADEFIEEIMYYSSVELIHYNEDFYKNISAAFGTVVKEIEPVSEMLSDFATILGKITISSEVINTLEVFGKLCKNVSLGRERYTDSEIYKSVYKNSFDTSEGKIVLIFEATNNTLADAA